ncbi:MAG: hypothetical protein L0H53_11700 [Candidatus Nitrosocosmicus sp.]|nr:hypothetical protein [Candidatus Nitrosocosmicus sp.]MDN5868382.1 hypothetical protein [Candidatus Nitrosocosmicus sp.]
MSAGISFSSNILEIIDQDRGDISRSRFLLRILEEKYHDRIQQKELSEKRRGGGIWNA